MTGKCGDCVFCEKQDGNPYCYLKDLYTTVSLDDECDEKDIRGNYYFTKEDEE